MCPDDCLFLSSVSPATCAGFVGQEPACRAHHWCCQAPGASPKKPHERQGELGTAVALARQHLPHRSLCQTSHPRLRSSLPTCAKSDVGFTTVGFLQCLKNCQRSLLQEPETACAVCRCPGEVAITRPYCPLGGARVVPGTSKSFAHTLSSSIVRHKLIIKKKEIVM